MVMNILENEAFSTFDIEMLHGDDISKVDVSADLKFSIVGPTIDERCGFCLEYLDGKSFEVKKVWFRDKFFEL